jgi:Ulp1 family protease
MKSIVLILLTIICVACNNNTSDKEEMDKVRREMDSSINVQSIKYVKEIRTLDSISALHNGVPRHAVDCVKVVRVK